MKDIRFKRISKRKVIIDDHTPIFPAFFPDSREFMNQIKVSYCEYKEDFSALSLACDANFRVAKRWDGTYFFDCSLTRNNPSDKSPRDIYITNEEQIQQHLGRQPLEDWIKSRGYLELEEKTPDGKRQFFVSKFRTDKSGGWSSNFMDNSIVVRKRDRP